MVLEAKLGLEKEPKTGELLVSASETALEFETERKRGDLSVSRLEAVLESEKGVKKVVVLDEKSADAKNLVRG